MELSRERALAVLYDIALATTGETRVHPLLNKVMQRLMYQTGYPGGAYLTHVDTTDSPPGSIRIDALICRRDTGLQRGHTGTWPAELTQGGPDYLRDSDAIAAMFGPSYRHGLRLPVASDGVFLLVSPTELPAVLPFTTLLPPVLANLSKVLHLCRENEAYTAALQQARDDAQRASMAKSDFLSHMSHELRTPLNAVIGFSQLLESDDQSPLTPCQLENVQEIYKAGRHLLTLINDILDLTRIESGKLNFSMEAIELQSLLTECVMLIEPLARQHRVTIEAVPCPVSHWQVHADHTRLTQAVINLLSNAVKYGGCGGQIRIECTKPDPQHVRIAVHDDGPGIDVVRQQRLFQPFERLGAEFSAIEGTGIGLVVTKKITELMGGRIGVESLPDQGSTFWIDLKDVTLNSTDAIASAAMTGTTSPQTPASSRRVKALYIEDNPANMRLVEKLVQRYESIDLLGASTPEQGLQLARDEAPDLVLLDINLPGMSGYEVLSHLRTDSVRRVLIVAVSANAMPNDIKRGREAGFDEYLTKPIVIQDFYRIIDTMLSTLSAS